MEVTVAAFGPTADEMHGPGYFDGPRFDSEGRGVPWSERQKVVVEAEPTDTLGDVIDRAADLFGVTIRRGGVVETGPRESVSDRIAGVALYKESDDLPGSEPWPWENLFPCISESRELSWRWLAHAPMGDLVRAYERGLLSGDPRRPYLWPTIPQGGEVFFGSWPEVLDALKTFLAVAESVAAVYGTVEAVERVKKAADGRSAHRRRAPSRRAERWPRADPDAHQQAAGDPGRASAVAQTLGGGSRRPRIRLWPGHDG